MRTTLVGVVALFGSGAALAQEMVGNPAAGEAIFAAQCGACHIIQNEAGEDLFLRAPNSMGVASLTLYGIAGRVPASLPDADYSQLLRSYGESGAVWEEKNFVPYVLDHEDFLHEAMALGGPSGMFPMIHDEQQAHELWAYITSFSPAEGEGAEGETSATVLAGGETISE